MKHNEFLTIRQRLVLAYCEGVISMPTILFVVRQWKIDLINEVCKN